MIAMRGQSIAIDRLTIKLPGLWQQSLFVGLAVALMILMGLQAGTARAGTIAYVVPAGTVGNQGYTGGLGMDFNVNQTIAITDLGVFDSSSNGLSSPITAAIYDRNNTATPLAQLVFATGVGDVLIDGSRFKSLSAPLILSAGFQGSIVAHGYDLGEPNGNIPVLWSTDSGGGALSFVGGGRFHPTPGIYPTVIDGGPANRYAAGTFMFEVVPEPASLAVLAIGLAGLGALRRRRSRTA